MQNHAIVIKIYQWPSKCEVDTFHALIRGLSLLYMITSLILLFVWRHLIELIIVWQSWKSYNSYIRAIWEFEPTNFWWAWCLICLIRPSVTWPKFHHQVMWHHQSRSVTAPVWKRQSRHVESSRTWTNFSCE